MGSLIGFLFVVVEAVDLGSGSSVNVCICDRLPCSRFVKGIAPSIRGVGVCVKSWRGAVRICCRFSDVSLFEEALRCKGDVQLAV